MPPPNAPQSTAVAGAKKSRRRRLRFADADSEKALCLSVGRRPGAACAPFDDKAIEDGDTTTTCPAAADSAADC